MRPDIKNILFTGGGSGGPVAPLIAVYEEMSSHEGYAFYWIGTKNGPEQKMLSPYPEIHFTAFPAAKLRRYFSLKTLKEPFVFLAAFLKALIYLYLNKPAVIISAGAYVSVPVAVAGWLMKIPVLIHQQDIQPTLSNKLMAPFAKVVTVTFEEQKNDFLGNSIAVTSNPVRRQFHRLAHDTNVKDLLTKFNLDPNLPILLVVGGGQGSKQINELVVENIEELTNVCQVIHITGTHYPEVLKHDHYHSYRFVTNDLPELLKVADIVITRAGMSFLSELSIMQKAVIIIPMPESHQVKNAVYLQSHDAVCILNFPYKLSSLNQTEFVQTVKKLINNPSLRDKYSTNISRIIASDAAQKLAKEVQNLIA